MSKYEVILDVYKTCSFSATAEKYNYTQSAVSQIVKTYEKQLGLLLFKRSHNEIVPTANAKPIMDALQKICDAEKEISETAKRLTSLETGYIRIGSIQSIAYHWLPFILKDFSQEYPNIRFEVSVNGFHSLTERLQNNELDCIFTSQYSVPGFSFYALGRDELMLVTPKDHPLADKLSVPLSDINGLNYISTSDGFDYETGQIFHSNNIQPNVRYQLDEDYAALKMVEAGFGITILPKLLLNKAPFDVCIRPFMEHYTRVLGIAYPSSTPPTPAMNVFLAYTKRWYQTMEEHA